MRQYPSEGLGLAGVTNMPEIRRVAYGDGVTNTGRHYRHLCRLVFEGGSILFDSIHLDILCLLAIEIGGRLLFALAELGMAWHGKARQAHVSYLYTESIRGRKGVHIAPTDVPLIQKKTHTIADLVAYTHTYTLYPILPFLKRKRKLNLSSTLNLMAFLP